MREHRAELSGRVKLQISGGERGAIDYPWQDNMILDQGFVSLITGYSTTGAPNAFSYVGVGSSSQAVEPTDVGLIAPIARVFRGSILHGWDAEGGFGWSRSRTSFPNGVAAGNISELATGSSNNNTSACARALVRDESGNPTTITVLADETLVVTWEWRRWWTVAEPHTIEYEVDGEIRTTEVVYTSEADSSKDSKCLGSGGILGIGGTKKGGGSLISSNDGVFVGEFKKTYASTDGNMQIAAEGSTGDNKTGGELGGSLFPYYREYCTFTPPIAKTEEFKLEIYFRIRLSRREP